MKSVEGCAAVLRTAQRTQRSRDRSTRDAAADSGSNVLDTSTQAQASSPRHLAEMNESATDERPEHSGPTISVMAPQRQTAFEQFVDFRDTRGRNRSDDPGRWTQSRRNPVR